MSMAGPIPSNGAPWDGEPVQMYPCTTTQYNQKWNLTGEIVHWQTDRCLRVGSTGNLIAHATCYDNSFNSVSDWDYYPITIQ
jgi:hypothetical protein